MRSNARPKSQLPLSARTRKLAISRRAEASMGCGSARAVPRAAGCSTVAVSLIGSPSADVLGPSNPSPSRVRKDGLRRCAAVVSRPFNGREVGTANASKP